MLDTLLRTLRDEIVMASGTLQMTAMEYMEGPNPYARLSAARQEKGPPGISIQCWTLFRFCFRIRQRHHRKPLPQLRAIPTT